MRRTLTDFSQNFEIKFPSSQVCHLTCCANSHSLTLTVTCISHDLQLRSHDFAPRSPLPLLPARNEPRPLPPVTLLHRLPPIRIILIDHLEDRTPLELEAGLRARVMAVLQRIVGEECTHIYWGLCVCVCVCLYACVCACMRVCVCV